MFTDEGHRSHQPTIGGKHSIDMGKNVDGGDEAKQIFHIVQHVGLSGRSPRRGYWGGAARRALGAEPLTRV